ncbi:integrin alpha-9 [Pelobates cultripes]|uniref:Integrin alpha-9 n=1 Tax=Pelobates cultripes TaxID=61616 RepID=A0AAD1W1T7_PELCU|nr:integrin alpha-9 [Pelobates cultripes]
MAGLLRRAERSPFKLLLSMASLSVVYCYNIDLDHTIIFHGPNGSFFGYSVLEHSHDDTRWVLVGAPKADSKFSSSIKSPGSIYKCRVHSNPDRRCTELNIGRENHRGTPCGKTCKEDRDEEWMGVSLARQNKADGSVLACAHRWKNIYYESEYILPHGFCSILPPNLQANGKRLIPCYEEYKKKYGEEHGSCQAGIAGSFMERLSGRSIDPVLRMFGQSISGGVDMDKNGYHDLTIGAFMSDSVVLLRTRPVISVDVSILLPASINITTPQCHDGTQQVNCVNISVCFRFHGKHVPGEIGLMYSLIADIAKKEKGQQPRVFLVSSGETVAQISEKIRLSHLEEKCEQYLAHVKRRVKDVISPIVFETSYSLEEHIVGNEEKELPALKPILRWKKGQKIAQRNQKRLPSGTTAMPTNLMQCATYGVNTDRLTPHLLNFCSNAGSTHMSIIQR